MKSVATIIASVFLMHIAGCAVFFGSKMGPWGVFGSPILSLFAWFMVPFEFLGVAFQWFLYTPKRSSRFHFWIFGSLSFIVGGLSLLLWKCDWLAFLVGAVAATTSFTCIHIGKVVIARNCASSAECRSRTEQAGASDRDNAPNSIRASGTRPEGL